MQSSQLTFKITKDVYPQQAMRVETNVTLGKSRRNYSYLVCILYFNCFFESTSFGETQIFSNNLTMFLKQASGKCHRTSIVVFVMQNV